MMVDNKTNPYLFLKLNTILNHMFILEGKRIHVVVAIYFDI